MSRELVTISQADSMSMVARLFRRQEIQSAPVVDEEGRCVGILSAADFVRREYALGQPANRASLPNSRGSVATPEDLAADHMTAGVQSIDPNRSLLAASRMMCASHIHHLLVINGEGQLLGMVSTMDIMAALINAVDEAEAVAR